jgi:transposase InsO family protein
MAAALKRRGYPSKEERQPWLDQLKYEYNRQRPHEGWEMQTPATGLVQGRSPL